MKNKNGFTLIELMIMTVAAVALTVFTLPKVMNVLDKSKDELYETQVTMIEKAAKNYYVKNTNELPTDDKDARFLSIKDLVSSNFLESADIHDPRTDEIMGGCVITKPNGKDYSYEYVEKDCSNASNEYAPTIKINSKKAVKVEVGSEFTFPEATAKDVLGKEIEVSGPYVNDKLITSLDTDKLNSEYDLVYKAYDETRNIVGIEMMKVKVVDTEPPVIRVNGKTKSFTYIQPLENKKVEEFDVDVTDNSGGKVDLKVTSTVSRVKGTGNITYLAKDKSGNITALVVKVKVVESKNPIILKVTGNPTDYQNTPTTLEVKKTTYLGDSLEYSFDNGKTWQSENKKEITEPETVKIKVKDMFGNESATWEEEVDFVDLSKPSVPEVTLMTDNWRGNEYDETWVNQDVYLKIKSEDEDSKIAYYEYSTDQNKFTKVDDKLYFDKNMDKTYYFRSVDEAGNVSDVTKAYNIKIDKQDLKAPTITTNTSVGETLKLGTKKWISGDINITSIETKKDSGSPISYYEVSTDNGYTWDKAEDTYNFSKNMSEVYYFRSVDEAGNVSPKTKALYVYIDRVKPATPQVTLKQNNSSGRTYNPGSSVLQPIYMKVQSADSGSGIDYYQYSFDNTTWKDLNEDEYTFKGPIDTPLYIRAIDKVGNISDTYETYIKIVK